MKKLTALLIFIACINHIQAQNILGAWQISAEETLAKLDKQAVKELIVNDKSLADFEKIMSSLTLAFYQNQTMAVAFHTEDKEIIEQGTWQYSLDRKHLIIFESNHLNVDTLEIIKAKKQKLILRESNGVDIVLFPSDTEIDTSKVQTSEPVVSPAVSKEVLNDIVKSIPSPIEISFLIKDLGVAYDRSLLAKIKNTNLSDFQNAWNFGVYVTNLGYAYTYGQSIDGLPYIEALQSSLTNLKVTNVFDFETIKKLGQGNNLDSLLAVTNTNLEKVNEYLQKQGRADLIIIHLTGSWLESLYLNCKLAQTKPNKLLDNRVGEQGIILDQLLLLLSFYENQVPNIKNLIDDLHKLKKIYDENVKIEYTYTDTSTPEVDEDGILMGGNGNPSSEIPFTKEDLKQITEVTTEIRRKMLN